MDLKEKLSRLPPSPGVYLMKDAQGHILYVGKSKNLKNRVRSYFQNSKNHTPKIRKLVRHLKDVDLIQTDTEFEAFMLECKLIKEHKPLYNRKMKSPQSYTYIRIRKDQGLQRLEVAAGSAEQDGGLCFGPYTSRNTVERAVQGIRESMGILCSSPYPAGRGSPCLNYSMGLCLGACLGGEALRAYGQAMEAVAVLLSGGPDPGILEAMNRRMTEAADRCDFEAAAKYRDMIEAVRVLLRKEEVIGFTERNYNIVVLEAVDSRTMKLFLIKGNRILEDRRFTVEGDAADRAFLLAGITRLVLDVFTPEPDVAPSPLHIGRHELDEAQIIYSYLKSSAAGHTLIPGDWLKPENRCRLDAALDELLHGQEQTCPAQA